MSNNDGDNKAPTTAPAGSRRYVPPAMRNRTGEAQAKRDEDRPEPRDTSGNQQGDRQESDSNADGHPEAKRASPPPMANSRFDCLKDDAPAQRYDRDRDESRGERGGKGRGGYDDRDQDRRAYGGGGDRGNRGDKGGGYDRGDRGGYDRDDRDDRGGKGRGKGAGFSGYSSASGDVRATNISPESGPDKSWLNRRDGRRTNSGWDEVPTELEIFGPVKSKAQTGINFDEYDKIPVQMSGDAVDAIKHIERFSEARLDDQLSDNIRRCGYERPTPIQKYSIPIVCSGRDLMACAQTGSGKTAAFLVPVMQSMLTVGPPIIPQHFNVDSRTMRTPMPIALVMAPTRELASQIADEGKKFAYNTGIRVCVVYGGADIRDQRRDVSAGVDVLVATPGRLGDMKERNIVSLSLCRFLMLDEADRMLDMGFEPQVRAVVEEMEMGKFEQRPRQSLMFSATFPKEVQVLAADFLYDYVFLTVGRVGSTNEFIEQKLAYADEEDKLKKLMNVLKESEGGSDSKNLALVFVETKRGADMLERELWSKQLRVTAIHGDRTQAEREEALMAFRRGDNPLLVATDVAARGLDIPDVQLVVNYDMPKNIDDYVHRIGRTGRAGRRGKAFAFINEQCNRQLLKELNGLLLEAKQERPLWFQDMLGRSGPAERRMQGKPAFDRFGGRDARQGQTARTETSRQWNSEERTGRKVETFRTRKEAEPEERMPEDGWGCTGAEDAWE
eukprot:GEMP01002730.1.p1 GENE.GEMP01002730.1~~GEMP01002730.1.p1  ORF type:complete len:728 (+),score=188.57 GEMP01002730.1:90-2273(+)